MITMARLHLMYYYHLKKLQFIGSVETTLAAIAGAKDQVLVLQLTLNGKKRGKIIVRADQVQLINDQINMKLRGTRIADTKFWFWNKTCPFLRFYRLRKDDNRPILVYETEYANQTTEPSWKDISVPS